MYGALYSSFYYFVELTFRVQSYIVGFEISTVLRNLL